MPARATKRPYDRHCHLHHQPDGDGSVFVRLNGNAGYHPGQHHCRNATITVNQPSLTWTSQSSGYNWNDVTDTGKNTQFSAEFSSPTQQSYMFGLNESLAYSGNITLSDNGGSCSGVATTTPALNTPTAYTTLSTSPFVIVTLTGTGTSNGCTIIATDDNSNTSTLQLYVDSSTVTIQGKARSHK